MDEDSADGAVDGWAPRDPTGREMGVAAVLLVLGAAALLWFGGGGLSLGLVVVAVGTAAAFVLYVLALAAEAWWVNRGVRDVRDGRDEGA